MSILSNLARRFRLSPNYDPSLIIRDVAYFSGSDAHVNHKLDIYLPSSSTTLSSPSTEEEPQRNVPVIVHVHGGAWINGSHTNELFCSPLIGRTCAREGYVGVVISYRLARVSPTSFMGWSMILGLIILILSFALHYWYLITGYLIFIFTFYIYRFFYKVRTLVNLEHVSMKLQMNQKRNCLLYLCRWSMIFLEHWSTFEIISMNIIHKLIPIKSFFLVILPVHIS